jgi:hypothetical protein
LGLCQREIHLIKPYFLEFDLIKSLKNHIVERVDF